MNDETELKNRMAALLTDQLVQIVRIDFPNYRPQALAFARQELQRRGFSKSDMTPDILATTVGTDQPSNLQLTLFVIATAAITILLFPATIYYSVLMYGLPAAAFLLVGYGISLFLFRTNPPKATAFAIGFAPPVVLALLMYFTAVPLYVMSLLLPLACAVLVTKLVGVLRKPVS